MTSDFTEEVREAPLCPACEQPGATYLGVLGKLEYFRCRECGLTFSTQKEEPDVLRT
jgi:tRNA(Ile2) C34 agmatinyltransferase TiaS